MKMIICDKNGKPIKEIVKNREWQNLRKSFLGTWKKSPKSNIAELRKYLGKKPWTNYDKLRRVYNYLTGTGFRTKTINHPSIDKLREEVKSSLGRLRS